MMRLTLLAVLSGALLVPPFAPPAPVNRVATEIVGGSFAHEIQAGDTLTSLGAATASIRPSWRGETALPRARR